MNTLAADSTTNTSPDLLESFVDYAKTKFIPGLASFFPGDAHVGIVCPMPDDMMPQHVGAFYITGQPDSPSLRFLVGGQASPITAMYVTMQTAITVAAVLEGRTQQLPLSARKAILEEVKTQLKFVVHEATHSVGDADLKTFQKEAELTARLKMNAWKESLTELSSQVFLNDIITSTGLDKADPMILQVDARDTGSYVGMVDATKVLIEGLSQLIPGTTFEQELKTAVGLGCGKTALDNLVGRALAARGVTNPQVVTKYTKYVASSIDKLQEVYLDTLSRLDRSTTSRTDALQAMDALRSKGEAIGRQIVNDISGLALSTPAQSPTFGRRELTLDDLADLLRQNFGSRTPRTLHPREASQGFQTMVGDRPVAYRHFQGRVLADMVQEPPAQRGPQERALS